MKLLLIKRKYVHFAINEKKRTVEAWVEPEDDEKYVNLNRMFTYELDHNTCNATFNEARLLGLLIPVEWLDGKKRYRAKAVCSPDDTWDPEIGKEIAYFRLCRRYLRLLKKLVIQNFYTFLRRNSDYFDDYSKDDLAVYLPWGNARHTETEIFIDRRLKALYRKGEPGQPQKNNPKKINLLPCPFCGAKDTIISTFPPLNLPNIPAEMAFVKCLCCNCRGPLKATEKEAVEEWNKAKR